MSWNINPLNAELNPICHLLALLGAHHILHVSRIRVKEITSNTFSFEGGSYTKSSDSSVALTFPFVSLHCIVAYAVKKEYVNKSSNETPYS
jgi:hypothetical protein